MTIEMNPEIMKEMAAEHHDAAEGAKTALQKRNFSVDAGPAGSLPNDIVTRVAEHMTALYRVHGTMGDIVYDIATNAQINEDSITQTLQGIDREIDVDE